MQSKNQPSDDQVCEMTNSPVQESFQPPANRQICMGQDTGVDNEDLVVPSPAEAAPLENDCYDVVSILYHKAKAVQVYEEYLKDVQGDTRLRQLILEIRRDEQRHIANLKNHLGRLLAQKPSPAP